MKKMCSSKTLGAGVLIALTASSLAGCAEEEEREDGVFHCAAVIDGVERAVDCDKVDDSNGTVAHGGVIYPIFLHSYPYTGATYAPGTALPADSKRTKIGYKDSAARQRFGLPASGPVRNGTVKTGVLGKGGGAAKGGSAKSGG